MVGAVRLVRQRRAVQEIIRHHPHSAQAGTSLPMLAHLKAAQQALASADALSAVPHQVSEYCPPSVNSVSLALKSFTGS